MKIKALVAHYVFISALSLMQCEVPSELEQIMTVGLCHDQQHHYGDVQSRLDQSANF